MNPFLKSLGFEPGKHSVRTEMLAGLTTFLTMSYILAVNPDILGQTGMDKGAVFTTTVIASVVATLVMAFYAKSPFVLAPGMGLNAFFAFTLVIGLGYSWQEALAAVFIEGVVFILLTIFKVREAIVRSIPVNIRYAITAGIGLFIALIGLKGGGIIVSNEATLVALGEWTPQSVLAILGVLIGGVLMAKKVKGGLFFTILLITLAGIPFGVTNIPEGFSPVSLPASIEPIALKFDFSRFLNFDLNYLVVVFSLMFMDLFDTLGTLLGASTKAGMVDEKGEVKNLNKALMADAVGTAVGAALGTSTVTTYVESTSGVAEGGRTGLTAFSAAMLFLCALVFSPIFMIIPSAATCSALVIVGVMMVEQTSRIDFSDFTETVPCFIAMVMMPFAYSISEGIVLGMLSYVVIKVLAGRFREVSLMMYILAAFFVFKYIAPFILSAD